MKFLSAGVAASFQDIGLTGHRHEGVSAGGAMDNWAVEMLHTLLENPTTDPVLEMHFPAPRILFEETTAIALGGADFDATLNEQPLATYQTYAVKAGDVLQFRAKKYGERAYLAVKGSLKLSKWLGSASYRAALGIGTRVEKGLQVELLHVPQCYKQVPVSKHLLQLPSVQTVVVRCLRLRGFDELEEASKNQFLQEAFTLSSEANRMGYRLIGKPLKRLHSTEWLSTAVMRGCLQCLPSGQIIILGADCQTTGGYPLLGTVCETDWPLVAQLQVGQSVRFQLVTWQQTLQALAEKEQYLDKLRASISLLPNISLPFSS